MKKYIILIIAPCFIFLIYFFWAKKNIPHQTTKINFTNNSNNEFKLTLFGNNNIDNTKHKILPTCYLLGCIDFCQRYYLNDLPIKEQQNDFFANCDSNIISLKLNPKEAITIEIIEPFSRNDYQQNDLIKQMIVAIKVEEKGKLILFENHDVLNMVDNNYITLKIN